MAAGSATLTYIPFGRPRADEPYKVANIESGPLTSLSIYAFPELDPNGYGIPTVKLAGCIESFDMMTPEQAEALADGLVRAAAVARGGERKPLFEYKSKSRNRR